MSKSKLLVFMLLISVNVMAQQNSQRRPPKVIKKFLENSPVPLGEMRPSIKTDEVPEVDSTYKSEFGFHSKDYQISKPLEEVWESYMTINPSVAWDNKSSKFAMAYDKDCDCEYYAGDEFGRMRENTQFFLELSVIRILKIPVGFEVTKVDEQNKVFEFTYLENNKSHGRQRLEFLDNGAGGTIIRHSTHFASDKKFRDKHLYAPIHENLLDDFHGNMKKLIED